MQLSDSDFSVRSQIYSEQVALLYKNAPLPLFFTVVNGFLLVYFLRPVISDPVLLTWFSTLVLVTFARVILVFSYYQAKSFLTSVSFWHFSYLVGVALSGSVFGSAAIVFFQGVDSEHQMFIVFILAGMAASSVPVLAASLLAYFLYVLPVLAPLGIQLFFYGEQLSIPMALIVLFFLLGLSVAAREMNRTILKSLMLRFDNHALVKEINERQTAEEALYLQKERLQVTFSVMAEGVIITAVDGSIEYLNPAAENMTGWLNSDAKGKKVEKIFNPVDQSSGESKQAAVYECLKTLVRSKKNCLLLSKTGEQKVIEEVATPLKNRAGGIMGAVEIIRDITQASEHSRELTYQANHDSLTSLPNRTLLCDRLGHAIAKASRADNLVAVLFMDLDRFKQVNDSLGHAAGDHLLQKVAERLRACIREEDTVARLGGDEFVVVLEDLVKKDQAKAVAQKIVDQLAVPLMIEGHDISVSVSIGITIFPRDGENVETLLKHADTAMYRTKELGQDNVLFYSEELGVSGLNRLKLEQQLKQAVAREELELYYQPRVSIDSGEIVGLEALVRWRTSANTLVSPAEFIHIAEETGAILRIGEWVLRTACEQAQSWCQDGHKNFRVAVNLSVRQIRSTNIAGLVAKVLSETNLDPTLLELEITESIFLKDLDHGAMILQDLRAQGIKLALDDFGTGYSSLTYIKLFPVDILKIDKSFIHDLTEDPTGGAIVPAIITMGHGLNLEVVAEGVENEVQRKYLSDLGCDSFQGYYFSKPLPVNEITKLLRDAQPTRQIL